MEPNKKKFISTESRRADKPFRFIRSLIRSRWNYSESVPELFVVAVLASIAACN
jgi:hypothetical protein